MGTYNTNNINDDLLNSSTEDFNSSTEDLTEDCNSSTEDLSDNDLCEIDKSNNENTDKFNANIKLEHTFKKLISKNKQMKKKNSTQDEKNINDNDRVDRIIEKYKLKLDEIFNRYNYTEFDNNTPKIQINEYKTTLFKGKIAFDLVKNNTLLITDTSYEKDFISEELFMLETHNEILPTNFIFNVIQISPYPWILKLFNDLLNSSSLESFYINEILLQFLIHTNIIIDCEHVLLRYCMVTLITKFNINPNIYILQNHLCYKNILFTDVLNLNINAEYIEDIEIYKNFNNDVFSKNFMLVMQDDTTINKILKNLVIETYKILNMDTMSFCDNTTGIEKEIVLYILNHNLTIFTCVDIVSSIKKAYPFLTDKHILKRFKQFIRKYSYTSSLILFYPVSETIRINTPVRVNLKLLNLMFCENVNILKNNNIYLQNILPLYLFNSENMLQFELIDIINLTIKNIKNIGQKTVIKLQSINYKYENDFDFITNKQNTIMYIVTDINKTSNIINNKLPKWTEYEYLQKLKKLKLTYEIRNDQFHFTNLDSTSILKKKSLYTSQIQPYKVLYGSKHIFIPHNNINTNKNSISVYITAFINNLLFTFRFIILLNVIKKCKELNNHILGEKCYNLFKHLFNDTPSINFYLKVPFKYNSFNTILFDNYKSSLGNDIDINNILKDETPLNNYFEIKACEHLNLLLEEIKNIIQNNI